MEIFLHQNGTQAGPFTEQQVRDMVKSGAISPADFAWHEGLAEWLPLDQVVSLSVPPPVPRTFSVPPPVPDAFKEPASKRGIGIFITAVPIVAIVGVIGFLVWSRIQHTAAGMKKLNDAQQELVSNLRSSLNDPVKAPVVAQQQIEHFSQELGNAGSDLQGSDKSVILAGQSFVKLAGARLQIYSTAYQALGQSGFTQAKGIETKEDLQHRRELTKAFGEANDQLADFYRTADATFGNELRKENLSESDVQTALKGFDKSASINLVLQVRQCDSDLVVQANKIFDIYDREWGNWHLNSDGKIIFQNDAAVADYNSAQGAIREIAEKQKAAQQQILQNAEAAGSAQ